jgi:hypothetical protein
MKASMTRKDSSFVALTFISLSLLWLAGGCRVQPVTLPGKERDPRALPGAPDNRAVTAENAQVSMKWVTSKEAPTTLIADDGTRCTVSEKQFNDTRIGDSALCVWRKA